MHAMRAAAVAERLAVNPLRTAAFAARATPITRAPAAAARPVGARFASTRIVGIDLGTTNSCVAVMDGDAPRVLENSEGNLTTPSVVAITKDGERLVGKPAQRQAVTNPKFTFHATKRLIGRKFADPEVKKIIEHCPYEIVSGSNGDAWVASRDTKLSPSEVGSMVLTKMKQTADTFLGDSVKRAVVTVPAYFNDSQRQATKDAGRIAGLTVERIINEPTAAAVAYGMDSADGKTVAVYDLGGGTFDVSILEVNKGVIEVRSTAGDTMLGGEDFDLTLVHHMVSEFKKKEGVDLSKDNLAMQRVREAAEQVKRELDSVPTAEVNMPYICIGADGTPMHMQLSVSRDDFEAMVQPLLERSLEPCRRALSDAGLTKHQVNEVLLVGGMTRMPKVAEVVEDMFDRKPSKGVNPDEVVAMGAALLGGVLEGAVHDLILVDVTPLTLGTGIVGDVFAPIIPRNTSIPSKKTETFTTSKDNQTTIPITVYQGERQIASANKRLGEFTLTGLAPAKRGVPQIEISFEINADGMLHVSARDKSTGKEQSITIQSAGGLTETEIENMMRDAELHAEADAARKVLVEARNEAESLAYSTESSLEDHRDKVSAEAAEEIEAAIRAARDAMDDGSVDLETMQARVEALRAAAQKIGEAVYGAGGAGGAGEEASEDDKKA